MLYPQLLLWIYYLKMCCVKYVLCLKQRCVVETPGRDTIMTGLPSSFNTVFGNSSDHLKKKKKFCLEMNPSENITVLLRQAFFLDALTRVSLGVLLYHLKTLQCKTG